MTWTRILKVIDAWQQNKNRRLPRKQENTMLRLERRLKLRSREAVELRKPRRRQLQIAEEARSIAERDSEKGKIWDGGWDREGCQGFRKKLNLQLRLLLNRSKWHTKKAGQRAAGVVREGTCRESGSRTLEDLWRHPRYHGQELHPTGHKDLQEPKAINKERSKTLPVWASRFWTGHRETTGSIASQERQESCEAEWCIQEDTAQRKVVAVENNRNLRRSPWRFKSVARKETWTSNRRWYEWW